MFDTHQILNLVGQLGGDHQQAAQELGQLGQIDPGQHAGLLQRFGIDPQQLQQGGYDQQLQQQSQPGFGGYQPGGDPTQQQPQFAGGGGGVQDPTQAGGYDQGQQGYDQGQQGYDQGAQQQGGW